MNPVWELIRPQFLIFYTENLALVLRERTELIVSVLQAQIGQLHLVYLFLALLRVDLDPFEAYFLIQFGFVEVFRAETLGVGRDEHELAPQPYVDFFFRLAHPVESAVIALVQKNYELTRFG
mmetsp:Transcript_3475/g.4612  ORF Transcript_3475/g.4612 Transcript_3475/m.4612 type:complete len:122 (+) Transcript_3475:1099-1464(+)